MFLYAVIDDHSSEVLSQPGSEFLKIFWEQQVIMHVIGFNMTMHLLCTCMQVAALKSKGS